MNEKRTIIAVVLAAVVAAAFTFFGPSLFGPPKGLPSDSDVASAQVQAKKASKSVPRAEPRQAARPAHVRPEQRPVERRVKLATKEFTAELTTQGAALARYELRDPQYHVNTKNGRPKPIDLVTTEREKWLPLRIEFRAHAFDYPREPDYEVVEATDRAVTFRYVGADVEVHKRFSLGAPYEMWLTTTVRNLGERSVAHRLEVQTWSYVRSEDEEEGIFHRSPWITGGICNHGGDVEHYARGDMWRETGKAGRVLFTGIENLYFLTAVAPQGGTQADCRLDADQKPNARTPQGTLYRASLGYPEKRLGAGEQTQYRTRVYLGPKERAVMARAGAGLQNAIDYSSPLLPDFLAFPLCRTLLAVLTAFYGFVGNWGVAIILLTVVIKVLLFPLTAKSFQSMREMQRVKPLIDDINKRHPDDRDRRNQAMMELYKQHKINPFGGCLPILLQTPIWIALYTTLWRGVELFQAPFALWYMDLSAPDPYFVLPLLLGVTMYVQQKITPSTLDPAQQKMMLYFMPVMFTAFMLFLPAGLCLYSLANSLLTIGQQRLLYRGLSTETPAVGTDPTRGPPGAPVLGSATPGEPRQARRARRNKR